MYVFVFSHDRLAVTVSLYKFFSVLTITSVFVTTFGVCFMLCASSAEVSATVLTAVYALAWVNCLRK